MVYYKDIYDDTGKLIWVNNHYVGRKSFSSELMDITYYNKDDQEKIRNRTFLRD